MKKYVNAEMEVVYFEAVDVISTSEVETGEGSEDGL